MPPTHAETHGANGNDPITSLGQLESNLDLAENGVSRVFGDPTTGNLRLTGTNGYWVEIAPSGGQVTGYDDANTVLWTITSLGLEFHKDGNSLTLDFDTLAALIALL